MRIHQHALLVLPALLSAFVAAFPSPTAYDQQRLADQPVPQQPRWRSLSDRLIGSVWGIESKEEDRSARHRTYREQRAPAHTLARYGGDLVLRFNISSTQEATSLAEAANTLLLDVWEYTQDWVDVRLSKDIVPSLLGLLPPTLQNSHTPLLQERDLAQAIYDTYPAPRGQNRDALASSPVPQTHSRSFNPSIHPADGPEDNIFFSNYQPLSVIEPWMRLLASLFTTHVRMISIGISYEGREIPALRVGVHPTNDDNPDQPKRKTVLISGGLHAREWIGTSTVNYIAYSLITGYGKVPSITALLEDFDFVFIPTLNPDGYVYTWETDRLWRKNRQQTNVRFCQGIDLDRGFGFEWDGLTTSGNPCSESFAGETPFEAVESKRLADWAKNETQNNNVDFVSFIDLHSYSQEILYPYSYSCRDTPPGQENLEELALGLGKAIRISSSYAYEVMAACQGNVAVSNKGRTLLPRIEEGGGSALDYFYHEMHVRYAYQIKLRDRGTYGFLLPKENIVPTGKEILHAVLYLGEFLGEVYLRGGLDADAALEGVGPSMVESEQEVVETVEQPQSDEIDQDWVWVEDLPQEDVQWELKRRRRR